TPTTCTTAPCLCRLPPLGHTRLFVEPLLLHVLESAGTQHLTSELTQTPVQPIRLIEYDFYHSLLLLQTTKKGIGTGAQIPTCLWKSWIGFVADPLVVAVNITESVPIVQGDIGADRARSRGG